MKEFENRLLQHATNNGDIVDYLNEEKANPISVNLLPYENDFLDSKFNLSMSCSEFLFNDDNYYKNLIVAIPINKCFKRYKDFNTKLNKIFEYINFLNQNKLFNFDYLSNKEREKVFNKYIEESFSKYNSFDFVKLCLSNNIDLESRNYFKYMLNSYKLTNNEFSYIKEKIKKFIDVNYSNIIEKNNTKSYTVLNLTNQTHKKLSRWSNHSFSNFINFIDTKQRRFAKLSNFDTNVIINYTFNYENYFDKRFFNNIFNENDLNFNIKTSFISNNNKFLNFLFELYIEYYKSAYKISKNKDKKEYFKSRARFYNLMYELKKGNLKIEEDKIKSLTSLINEISKNTLFIKIDKSKLKIRNHRRLLICLTMLRYMYFQDYEHLADIVLKFKNNLPSLSVFKALFLASNFHNHTAWSRFNLLKVKEGSYLRDVNYKDCRYFKYPGDSYIESSLKDKHNKITYIFSNDQYKYNLSVSERKNLYEHLNRLLKNENYEEIEKIFDKDIIHKKEKKICPKLSKSMVNLLLEDESFFVKNDVSKTIKSPVKKQVKKATKKRIKNNKKNYFISKFTINKINKYN